VVLFAGTRAVRLLHRMVRCAARSSVGEIPRTLSEGDAADLISAYPFSTERTRDEVVILVCQDNIVLALMSFVCG